MLAVHDIGSISISNCVYDRPSAWFCSCLLLQAMLDVAADAGLLATSLQVISVMQMVMQARWNHENSILILPHLQSFHLSRLRRPWVVSVNVHQVYYIAILSWRC